MAIAVVRATMIVATVAWAIGEVLMRRSPASDRLARASWTVGVALALAHVVFAFQVVYAWSHEAAVDSHCPAGRRSLRLGLARRNLRQLRLSWQYGSPMCGGGGSRHTPTLPAAVG